MSREFALKQAEEQIDILREALLESKEENEELETRLSLSISMYEGDRSPMHKLEEENAALKRENEVLADFKDEVEAVSDLMYQYTMRRLTEQESE